VIVGGPGEPVLPGTTSVAFGRTQNNRGVLYITTNGGISDPSAADLAGGKVAALDTRRL
jgi:hypothetical protein